MQTANTVNVRKHSKRYGRVHRGDGEGSFIGHHHFFEKEERGYHLDEAILRNGGNPYRRPWQRTLTPHTSQPGISRKVGDLDDGDETGSSIAISLLLLWGWERRLTRRDSRHVPGIDTAARLGL